MLKTIMVRTTLAALACAISLSAHAIADSPKQTNVPAGDLVAALESLARQADVSLVYQAKDLVGIHTSGAHGNLTPQEAVTRLLVGTKLHVRTDAATGAMLIERTGSNSAAALDGKQGARANATGEAAQQADQIQGGDQKKSIWDRFRVAQVDQGTSAKSGSSLGGAANSARADQDPDASVDSKAKVEEIIVTSQKRVEKLQDVPVSVQVIGGSTLQQQNYNTLDDVLKTVPGVASSDLAGQGNTLFIRGIGSGTNTSFDQSVATFYDDIFHGRSRMSGATFLDLDRIEVLKGPQSTFFGNNAIAGALNIVTKKPGDTFDGWGRMLYGQFGQYAVEGAVGGPLTDTFGARIAVTRSGGSGWLENVTLGNHVPRVNDEAARLTLVYKPTQDLDATLRIEGSQHKAAGSSFGEVPQAGNCPPPAPFANSNIFFCPELLALRLAGVQVPIGLDNNQTSGIAGAGNWLSTAETALTLNYNHWGHTFTSVTGFYNYHYNAQFVVPEPQSLFNSTAPERYSQFSQELRVASPLGGPVEYLAGAYFQTDKLYYASDINLPYVGAILPGQYLGIHNDDAQGEHTYAVFGSATWNITDSLKLSGGLRGSWDKKDYVLNTFTGLTAQVFQGLVPQPDFFGPPVSLSGKGTWHDWMPSAKIQYQLAPQALGYFSFSQGWKAGGFNGVNPTDNPADVPYGPEHVNAYELGLKSEWLADSVLVNLALFRSSYSDLQVGAEVANNECPGACYFVRNAASSITQGVELEAEWVASHEFQLAANVSYIDAYYVNYPNGSPTSLAVQLRQPFEDLSGRRVSGSPRWSGSISATYSTRLPDNYKLIAQLLPYFQSNYYQDFFGQFQGAYTRLDARLALETPDGRWGIDLIGKNLADRVIPMVGAGVVVNTTQVVKQEPRNIAIQVRYKF